MDIMTGLSAISQTLDITKELRQIDRELDKAELKLRLADLVDGLLEAKEALQDAKERERELRQEILELKEALADRGRFEDERGLLYRLDNEGRRDGEPYCNLCYVREDKLYRCIFDRYVAGAGYYCKNCREVHYVK